MTYPAISKVWAYAVNNGDKTIEEVPEVIRKNVLTILQNLKQEGGTYD